MPYSRGVTKNRCPSKPTKPTPFMKTNTIQVITTTLAIALVAGFAGTKVTGDHLTGIAMAVSYLTVAAVVAMAASDYRGSQRV
jgi:hypothetical protein